MPACRKNSINAAFFIQQIKNQKAGGVKNSAWYIVWKKCFRGWRKNCPWYREAGLEECTVNTFVSDAHAPLGDELRDTLVALFRMRWPDVESELSPGEWAEYQRLCLPESPDFILDHPDYYAFFTYSMFHGRIAG